MTSPDSEERRDDYEGPRVHLPGDVRENSRAYGLPVVDDDGYNHAPECYWCDGHANSDTCPRSIQLTEYVREFDARVARGEAVHVGESADHEEH